jgi:AGZA family xanthine/uracil permease-like MFS transporter
VLTYFGFMHGEAVGIGGGLGVSSAVALAYAGGGGRGLAVGKYDTSGLPVWQLDTHLAVPAE